MSLVQRGEKGVADEQIQATAITAAKLRLLRAGLMTDLLTGRMRVPDDLIFTESA